MVGVFQSGGRVVCSSAFRRGGALRFAGTLSLPPASVALRAMAARKGGTTNAWLRAVLVGLALVLAGCGGSDEQSQAGKESGLEKTFERGPVKVVLRLDNPTPSIADRIRLAMEVTADESYEVEMPAFGEKLEQFGIVEFDSPPPQLLDGGRIRELRSYVLEPFLSGDYRIPAMVFRFRKRDGGEGEGYELETDELKVVVSSLLPEEAENLEIHEIAPPVQLPKKEIPWRWIIKGGAVLVVIVGAVTGWLRRRKKKVAAVPPRPAHEIAFEELEALIAGKLAEKGEIKAFYQRISDILRRYIENRFGLRAPERTTEEFLVEMKTSEVLDGGHKVLLGGFLQHCDLVKFAEHQPSHDDIQKTFDACKEFILETKESSSAPTAS